MTEPQPPYGPPPGYGQPAGYGLPPGYGPPPGYPATQGYGPPVWQGPQETDSKAVVALVCAIGSFVVLPLLPAIAALFLARAAQRDIDASGGRLSGAGLVTAARITAWINIGLSVAVTVVAILALAVVVIGASG